jgi:hypothetical protein
MNRREFLLSSGAVLAMSASGAGPSERDLPFRQVHLDFHNGGLIPDIGTEFDARQFVATLKRAHVNSINIFAKCMHGYAYYETKIAAPHPSLKTDLLGAMLKELRPAGISANYYYGLTWDALAAARHPEWRILTRDGKPIVFGGHNSGVEWQQVCLNSPYLDQVERENEEILTRYRADGAWFDIAWTPPDGCFCQWCRAEREQLGLPDTPAGIRRHNKMVALRMESRLTGLVHRHWPEALVFYNSRTVLGIRNELANYTHIEIESLPTGGWGYAHLQQRVRHMRTLGKQVVGMNGRFHKSWGDFGGLKNQAAMDYELLSFLANGPVAPARTAGCRHLRSHRRDLLSHRSPGALRPGCPRRDRYRRDLRRRQFSGNHLRPSPRRHRLHQYAGGTAPAVRCARSGEPL